MPQVKLSSALSAASVTRLASVVVCEIIFPSDPNNDLILRLANGMQVAFKDQLIDIGIDGEFSAAYQTERATGLFEPKPMRLQFIMNKSMSVDDVQQWEKEHPTEVNPNPDLIVKQPVRVS